MSTLTLKTGRIDAEPDHESRGLGNLLRSIAIQNDPRRDPSAEVRGLTLATGAGGGYLLPKRTHDEVVGAVREFSVIRAGATIVPMQDVAEIDVPALRVVAPTAAGLPGSYSGGFAPSWQTDPPTIPASDADPEFGSIKLTIRPLMGTFSVPMKLLQRSAPSFDTLARQIIGAAVAHIEDYAFLNGDGIGKPLGILRSPALIATAARAASGTITLADRLKLWASVLPSSKPRAHILASQSAEEALLTGVAAGELGEGDGETFAYSLLGRPVHATDKLPALNTAGDLLAVDPRYYLIGDGGIEIASSAHYDFRRGLVWFRAISYVAGAPWPSGPITLTDGSTTASPFVCLGTA